MRETLESISFRTLFELANDAIIVVDVESQKILDANQRAMEWMDRTLEELRDMDVLQVHPTPERKRLLKHFQERSVDGGSSVLTCHLLRRDGSTVPCELSARRIVVKDRKLAVGIFRDLSERVRTLEDIRLRDVAIQGIQAGISIADARLPDLPLIYINGGFEKITGYKAREVVGRSCRFLQGSQRDQPALNALRTALREGRACDVRLRNYRKDGSEFWNELHISPVYNEDNELTHFVGIQIDVTDRVEARKRIEESERRYRTLADSVDDIIMRRHRCGKIFFVSPSVERNLGYAVGELLETSFLDLIHPEDRLNFSKETKALNGDLLSSILTYRVQAANGEYLWIESRETLLRAVDGQDEDEIVSVGRDVTMRRRAEEEVRRSLERERELGQLKTRFIQMVSHEFRTPMTAIRASSAFLRQWGDGLEPEKRQRHFDNIERSLGRMNRLIDDVLFISRNETHRIEFAPECVHPTTFTQHLIDDIEPLFPGRKVQFSSEIGEDECFQIDPNLFRHFFQNLLSNAFKYSPCQQPVEVRLTRESEGGVLLFTVRDHGIGIPEEERKNLFEPFVRCHNTGSINGTGLGLNIAKRSVELHGGAITFTSALGQGTEFTVRLPVSSCQS
jgi:PAS domain S-box-containing protein